MEKRYDDLLTTRIEEVTRKGWSFINWWEAYLWYGQAKLGKHFWVDLKEKFDKCNIELDRNKTPASYDLYYSERNDGVLLIHGDILNHISIKIGTDAP